MSTRKLLVGAAFTLGAIVASLGPLAQPAEAAPADTSVFHAVNPTRLLDTHTGLGAPAGPIHGGRTISLQVAGRGGLPASGVSAVALTVTVTGATGAGFITAFSPDDPVPTASTASNVNFAPGDTATNLVVSRVGTNGRVILLDNAGAPSSVTLTADVSGYYLGGRAPASGTFVPLPGRRLLDTRGGIGAPAGPVAPDAVVALTVGGRGGVPADGVSAVVLNLTATASSAAGAVSAYASGDAAPPEPDLQYRKGQTIAHLAIVAVGDDGVIELANSGGAVQLVADVSGYFLAGRPSVAGGFGALTPSPVLDTRTGIGAPAGAVGTGHSVTFPVEGRGNVPVSAVAAVVLNVTATDATSPGQVTAYAPGQPIPGAKTASNLNYSPSGAASNLVIVPVSSSGQVSLVNYSVPGSTVQLAADVVGYFGSTDLAVPTSSVSRYVRNLSDTATDEENAATMHEEGCSDGSTAAQSGPKFVLLDIGAQTRTDLPEAGVRLSTTSTRLTNAALVAALKGYLAGYESCFTGAGQITIAAGTNNDGDFDSYTADQKGADWATQVVEPLRLQAAADGKGVKVAGANDIEAEFASTEAQAEAWINSYLADTPADLIENGSADACPIALGITDQPCQDVTSDGDQGINSWTQQDYYQLAHGINPTRIKALPQIYVPSQAGQWANISLTGAKSGGAPIAFLGPLTQQAACGPSCSLPPGQAWATLWYALSTDPLTASTAPTDMPIATDLRSDS